MAEPDTKDGIAVGALTAAAPAIAPQESPPLPAPAPAAAPPAEAAPAAPIAPTAAAVEPPKVELATDKPSLLETFDKDAKPASEPAPAPAKPDAAKPAEAKPGEEAKPPVAEAKPETASPIEYALKVPETIKADDPRLNDFTATLREANLPAELGSTVGQKLLDMHAETMRQYAEGLAQEQHRVFNATRDGWQKDVLADAEIGGAGHVTAMRAIARARDYLVSDAAPGSKQYEADFKAHEDFMRITGAGDHPVYLKMLHHAARYVDEPQAETIPSGIQPPPTNGKNPNKRVLYDHPSSSKPS